MRFAHLADVHIGAWRDPKMKGLAIEAFERAVDLIIERQAEFLLIAGDLFNTSVPPLDQVKRTVTQLQRLKSATIGVYAIAGSHDYSPSGKTMLDVLEEAGLLVNVMKGDAVEDATGQSRLRLRFTVDPRTGVKLVGILGRAGSLDKAYYEDLDREALEAEPGEKIFLFHASITELKPKTMEKMESSPLSLLPKGFDYYAGGHVHIIGDISLDGYRQVVYPGPLFPASFSELEELGNGSLCMVDGWRMERVPVTVRGRVVFALDADGKSADETNAELERLAAADVEGKIVLLRATGELREGRVSDLRFPELIRRLTERGAYFVMKNTARLTAKGFEEYQTGHANGTEIEGRVIREHIGQVPIGLAAEEEVALTKTMLDALGEEQHEGEKKYEYEERVVKAAKERLER